MNDRLQTQRFGPYFSSFSAHSYCYELSNDAKICSQTSGLSLRPLFSDSLLLKFCPYSSIEPHLRDRMCRPKTDHSILTLCAGSARAFETMK